jgi:hypothetical protein
MIHILKSEHKPKSDPTYVISKGSGVEN